MSLLALADAHLATAGGKAAGLAPLLRAGLPVPAGFVVPTGQFVHGATRLSSALAGQVDDALRRMFGAPDGGHVAVRSSATTEDGPASSGAGMHDTVLAVRGTDAVCAAIVRCWGSLETDRARAYRAGSGDRQPAMAVLVQEFVDADVSGVLFTGERCVIEAVPGLGDLLVGGLVTPDAWTVDADGAVTTRMGVKTMRSDRVGDRVVSSPLSTDEQAALCLTEGQVRGLDALGRKVTHVLGGPADVEWAVAGGRLHVLQARPVTADLPDSPAPRGEGLRGIAAGPGGATGPARIVRGPRDFATFRPGDVLVCEHTDPAWTPLFRIAAAVVTEHGGLLSHAAIVAREVGIPAVLAVPDATRTLVDGALVTVDGHRGQVRRPDQQG